jgi:hypothetical protein
MIIILTRVCGLRIRLSHEQLVDAYLEKGLFRESTRSFLEKILANSGMGPATALSHGIQGVQY